MPDTQPPDPWSLRASDAERDACLTLLREAYAEGRLDGAEYEERMQEALAAKTYRELLPVVRDLPVDPARLPRPPMAPQPYQAPANLPVQRPVVPVPVPMGLGSDNSLLAIFGSAARKGVWQVPPSLPALALFGEVKLNLINAVLPGPITELKCNAVFGSVEIVVPDALHVEVNGTGVFGSFEKQDKRKGANKQRVPAAGAPLIRITGVALFGSVEVKIVTPKGGHAGVTMLEQQVPQPPPIEGPGTDSA